MVKFERFFQLFGVLLVIAISSNLIITNETFKTYFEATLHVNEESEYIKPRRNRTNVENWISDNILFDYDLKKEEPMDKNQKCVLEQLHPFDESIIQFVKKFPVDCKIVQKVQFLTYIDDNGILRFNETEISEGKIDKKNCKCKYNKIVRDNEDPVKDGYKRMKEKPFNGTCDVSNIEFLEISCRENGSEIYHNFHSNIPKSSYEKMSSDDISKKYNVLIFGIDSLSRLNAMRNLPKPYSYMKDVLNGFIFRGHQKVWSNTFPNVATMLTGHHPYQEPWPFEAPEEEKKPHDPWPFIWKNFSSAGYRTMFSEDDPVFNIFHYASGGFKKQPTDHFMRTFWTALEGSKLFESSTEYCFGNIPKHPLHYDYLKRFFDKMHGNNPFFVFSWMTKICHGYLNSVQMANDDILNLFKHIHDRGYLNDTIMFFLSDHGNRFSDIRNTYIGSIEDKMPLCSLYVPERFRKSQPHAVENLQTNVMRPTSVFDIFCTLKDILKLSLNESHKVGEIKTKHGISMFGKIPQDRTCGDAGIDGSFCTCQEKIPVPVNSSITIAAQNLVNTINDLIVSEYRNFSLCAKLELKEVIRSMQIKSEAPEAMYIISFETSPNNGMFDGTVSTKDFSSFTLVGEIERTNQYGNQPWCISHRTIRAYCYCKPKFDI